MKYFNGILTLLPFHSFLCPSIHFPSLSSISLLQYDSSCQTLSPDGRIFQVEYAQKAVDLAGTAIGLKCSDGIVLAVEKPQSSKLLVAGSNRRIFGVDKHVGIAVTGTSADGRQFVNRAREEAGSYYDTYGHRILPNVLASRLALYAHYFTMGHYRPFGCAALSAGYDADMQVPELYMVEPSGQCLKYYACAAGKGAQAARTELEKVLNSRQERGITCLEAVDELARILHVIRDPSKDKPFELEMGWLTETSGYTYTLVPADAVKAADAKGKASLEGSAVVPVAGASAGGAGMDL
jgi:20S proteasome subunit alpha 7